jgi:putative hydrolase of the HAD superfamily
MRTVVFDLDDTLYDRTQPLFKGFTNFEPARDLSFADFHKIYTKNSDIGFEQFTGGKWSLEESHIFRIKETLHEMGIDISSEQAQSFQASYQHFQHNIELYPSIVEILDFLHERKIQTLIITNGPSAHQRNKIKNLGLEPYFTPNEVIISDEVGIAKPDRGIFKLAEERFHIDRNHAWYIGDSYSADMMGASNAGWNTIWFNKNKELDLHPSYLPTKTVSSTSELKEYLFTNIGIAL